MQELRANTQVKVKIGPAVAVGDGFTPVTTLDLSTADEAELFKHDSAAVTDISGATFAAITSADGWYNLTLTTSHLDTEGLLDVIINDDSLILPLCKQFMVLSEAAYDSKYVAKDDGFMDVNIKTIGRADTQETEATNLEAACAAYSATRGLTGTALPAAAADAAGGLPISDAGGLDLDAKIGALTFTVAGDVDVNVQTWGGTAIATPPAVNATQLSGSATAADNAEIVFATDFATNYSTTTDKWQTEANVLLIEGSDATDQIRDALVDDATRIDASALNTASGAIGSNGTGLTEAGGTGDHLTALATASALSTAQGNITSILADTNELQGDWTDGGRLDSILDIVTGLGYTAPVGSTGNDTTHVHLPSLSVGNDAINNQLLVVFDSSGTQYHSRWIDDYVAGSQLATVATLPFTPDNTDTFWLLPIRRDVALSSAGVTAVQSGLAMETDLTALITTVGAAGAGLTEAGGDGDHLTAINLPNQTMDIVGNITGNLSGNVGGIAGTITTLDALDTAQDTQHGTTQTAIAAVQADLPARITKNTALAAFPFKMVDATDHVTAETGVTVTATRSIDGAAFGACANAVSEVSNGWYKIDLAAGDLNGNTIVLRFTGSGCDTNEVVIVTQNT